MLKPLLLLCWTAIFVSAGDQKISGVNGASVPINLTQERTNIQPQLSSGDVKPAIPSSEHVPSILNISATNPEKLSDSNADTKSKVPDSPVSDEGAHESTESITITPTPTTNPTTTITPSTIKQSTTTPSTTTISTTTSTTTTVPTSTKPVPTTPVPPPSTKKWIVKDNNITCIIVQMAAQFCFSYTVNNKTIQKTMDIPGTNGTVSGICGNNEQNLTVSWFVQNDTDNFTMHFVKNDTTKRYSLHHFEISLAPEEFPADKWNKTVTLVHIVPQYETGMSNSYRCLKEQKLNLYMKGVNETVGHLTVSDLQFQAFRSDNSTTFGVAKDCAFDTPDIVPITVGCALAGLVVIVLIAYLVSRRRSQARGYLSM